MNQRKNLYIVRVKNNADSEVNQMSSSSIKELFIATTSISKAETIAMDRAKSTLEFDYPIILGVILFDKAYFIDDTEELQ